MTEKPVMWVYWSQEAGVPKGISKTHLLNDDETSTLCDITLHSGRDYEYGDGTGGYCKKCEKNFNKLSKEECHG